MKFDEIFIMRIMVLILDGNSKPFEHVRRFTVFFLTVIDLKKCLNQIKCMIFTGAQHMPWLPSNESTIGFHLKPSADFLQALILVVSAALSGVSSQLAASVVLQSFSVVMISNRRIQTKLCREREKETGVTERERDRQTERLNVIFYLF